MKIGKTRIKLAKIIETLCGPGSYCDPSDLKVNKGRNTYNDWSSWYGWVYIDGFKRDICSWTPMGEIVASGSATWVSKAETGGTGEICESNKGN